MSSTPVQELPAGDMSSGSVHTLRSRPLQPISDPSASKRVCFYKSGDYTFSGHRIVINARTFKTFDALLDALSKKVPLPFGVRTITTPRGTHLVKALDDLHDGGSYVCSDQKRVKPLNLDEVNRRQVPWNTTRPMSAGRRRRQGPQFSKKYAVVTNRPAERVAVRTPKKLLVIKNREPTVKRTIVLQRRTAPTFDALLDYLSQILQFPVLKLFSTDGRRVEGLAGLILCAGVVVAAGNEPFKLGNYTFQGTGQMTQVMYMETVEGSVLQTRTKNNKSVSTGRGSRNFSLSSERYIVNQINKSRNGSRNGPVPVHHHDGSFETEVNHHQTSVDTCGTGRGDSEHHACIVPQDDDIEKSFRVNQDGSMTVEMKVRLTIKEEEMLHWTTTLSRSSLSTRTVCASISESDNSSPDSNNAVAKDSSSVSEDESKEENRSAGAGAGKSVGFNGELAKNKTGSKRTPTPGPRHVRKKASIESVKTVTESGVQESTLGHYSYMERTADGETTEGYCMVRHSSSSSRPIPKPRKTPSAGASNKGSHSSIRSSGVAEVLQIQNNGMEVTETVMHIYESQGCYDNYLGNEEYSADGAPMHGSASAPESKLSTGGRSSSNDCDIDFSLQPAPANSVQRQKEEMLSLSSEPISPTQQETATNSQVQETVRKDKTLKDEMKKKIIKPPRNQKSSPSTSSSGKKQKESMASLPKNSKHSSTDKLSSNASKKTLSSAESAKSGRKSRGAERPQMKKFSKDEKMAKKEQALLADTDNVKTPPKRQNISKTSARYNGHNVNSPTERPQMKKNISDILQPKKSLLSGKKTISKPKSMTGNRIPSPKQTLDLSESFSMPNINPSPSEIHQYVESWLEKVSADPVPYAEETIADGSEPRTKVVFQIGADSESDGKDERQTHLDDPSPADVFKKSPSCLSVPLCHQPTTLPHNEHYERGLCVSMPSVRDDRVRQENRLRPNKSAGAIGLVDNESSSSTSNLLDPKAKLKPILGELYSSIHCIRSASEMHATSNLEKSNSLPDFSKQVASVFGSSCKAFVSFLSVMTLRDNLMGSALGDSSQSRSPSEAMLMMESLQKLSVIEDEEELRVSLTDLQSRASSRFRERWKDFQIMRERLESEPLSPRVSETEFALDVFSEGGDPFEDMDELMDELNMPDDLRAEITSTIHQTRTFYPVEESTFVETEKYQSDSEEDLEKFGEESNDETKQSLKPKTSSIAEDPTDNTAEVDNLQKMQSECSFVAESEQEPEKESEKSQVDGDETLTEKENEAKEEEVEGDDEGVNDQEGGDQKEISEDGSEEIERGEREREEEAETEVEVKGQEESEKASVEEEKSVQEVEEEEGEEEVTEKVDKEEEGEQSEGAEEGLMDKGVKEEREDDSVEETEVEKERRDEADDEEQGEETRQGEEIEEESDGVIEESDQGEEVGNIIEEVEEEGEEAEEDADEVTRETDGEEVGNIVDEVEEDGEADEVIGQTDEGVELENIEEAEEEASDDVKGDEVGNIEEAEEDEVEEEEEASNEVVEESDAGEELVNIEEAEEDEVEEEEEASNEVVEESDAGEELANIEEAEEEEADEDAEEEAEEGIEENNEAEELKEVIEAEDEEEPVEGDEEEKEEEEEEETDVVTEAKYEEDEEEVEEKEDKTEVVSEDNNQEEEEREQEVVEDDEDIDVRNTEEGVIEDEEEDKTEVVSEENVEEEEVVEEGEDVEGVIRDEEKEGDEGEELEKTETSVKEESVEEKEVGAEFEESMKAGQMLEEEEREGGEENEIDEVNEGCNEVEEQESRDEVEEENAPDDADNIAEDAGCENLPDEASCLQQQSSFDEVSVDAKEPERNCESLTKYSSEGQCEDDKGNGTDTVNELDTDEGGDPHEGASSSLPHPVEISQELLDFVNSALRSSSLVFTYDTQGNIRLEPDNTQVTQCGIPKRKKDSYGLKCLPSPCTSDLSDYRPETSESGGYKSQDSVDIVTESGEEVSPVCRRKTVSKTNAERANSNLSVASNSEVLQNSQVKSRDSFSSCDIKASKEDLSYFSAASSQKADAEPAPEATQCTSLSPEKDLADGVLIDQGRWLLKENHLIRKSPPVSSGMYGQLDSTSIDTGQENSGEDSPSHCKTQHSPLAAISSSELEEMAKPKTPKCTYYNMPHGSDSDPFLDDSSVKSGKKGASRRGIRVSPTIDTTKTWASKNGSMSSFASVEFKIPDRKVHPEGESSAVTRPRRTSSGAGSVLQAQDSLDTLHVRCGQYCPIL